MGCRPAPHPPSSFFDRAADAPPLGRERAAALRDRPLRDLGVQDAYAVCLERDDLAHYQEFVADYPGDALARRVRALIAARREATIWQRTWAVGTPDAYWSYLARYPRGPHAWDARRRLASLAAAYDPPPRYSALAYDVPAPPPDEIVYVERPYLYLDDPVYALPPPAAAAGLLAAAADLPRSAGAPASGLRNLRAADAADRSGADLRVRTGLRGAAAEQRRVPEHPQHDRHRADQPPEHGDPNTGRSRSCRRGGCRGTRRRSGVPGSPACGAPATCGRGSCIPACGGRADGAAGHERSASSDCASAGIPSGHSVFARTGRPCCTRSGAPACGDDAPRSDAENDGGASIAPPWRPPSMHSGSSQPKLRNASNSWRSGRPSDRRRWRNRLPCASRW